MKPRGFSLIELLISVLLGLLLLLGVINLFSATRQVYRSNTGLAEIQENSRIAFELLARDIRQANFIPCGNADRMANVLNNATSSPLRQWLGFQGFSANTTTIAGVPTGTATTSRIAGIGALLIQGTENTSYTLASHNVTDAKMTISSTATTLDTNDILLVCDTTQASIFQTSEVFVDTPNTETIITHANTAGTTGNCTKGLGVPLNCDSDEGNPYAYNTNATLARFYSSLWYIGNNGQSSSGGRSLYRARLEKNNIVYEEIVSGVNDLELQYHIADTTNAWLNANAITDWSKVDAVKITLAVQTSDTGLAAPNSNDGRLEKRITHIIALRNRIP